MIRLAENIDDLRRLCAGSPFGCPILSSAEGYGLDRLFAQFWTDDRAAYGKLDGVMRIAGEIEDAAEAKAFLYAVGAESVVCSAENARKLGLRVTEQGAVLYKDLPAADAPNSGEVQEEVPLRKVYEVLAACDMVGDFEPFYLDLSHRVRHGCAVCTAVYEDGEMAAAAVAAFGSDCALISAVGVKPDHRRKGLGKRIVRQMEKRLPGRVFLLRAENENERFYASLGYAPCGAWCAGTLE